MDEEKGNGRLQVRRKSIGVQYLLPLATSLATSSSQNRSTRERPCLNDHKVHWQNTRRCLSKHNRVSRNNEAIGRIRKWRDYGSRECTRLRASFLCLLSQQRHQIAPTYRKLGGESLGQVTSLSLCQTREAYRS
jgi:oligoendopeptidase F